jgi:hypothetical protein
MLIHDEKRTSSSKIARAPAQALQPLALLGYPPPAMSLEARIVTVGEQIAKIARRLPALGYPFHRPSAAFPGPEPGTEAAIERIEREVGRLPLALKAFWRIVGSVDFTARRRRSQPVEYPWDGCEYPDPLVVYPPSVAIAELDEFLGDREERLRCGSPYIVPIAPDDVHKDNVSGGMCYNLTVPAVADDPPLNDEWHRATFVSYLELAVRWGGFPGLERCPEHGWPLRELVGAPAREG